RSTARPEKILALKFLLHFVGDVHQPLHSADEHDAGGNNKTVIQVSGGSQVSLHSYWDTTVIGKIETDENKSANALATDLATQFVGQKNAFMSGRADDWAMDTFGKARDAAYDLPRRPNARNTGNGPFRLTAAYERRAATVVKEQLAKAGM